MQNDGACTFTGLERQRFRPENSEQRGMIGPPEAQSERHAAKREAHEHDHSGLRVDIGRDGKALRVIGGAAFVVQPIEAPSCGPGDTIKEQIVTLTFENAADVAGDDHADQALQHPTLNVLTAKLISYKSGAGRLGMHLAINRADGLSERSDGSVEWTERAVVPFAEDVRCQPLERQDVERLRLLPAQASNLGCVVQLDLTQQNFGDEVLTRDAVRAIIIDRRETSGMRMPCHGPRGNNGRGRRGYGFRGRHTGIRSKPS